MKAVELFAGAGGLALGTSSAGFRHAAVVERDRSASDTIAENNRRGVINWPLHQCDVREFDFRPYAGAQLLAGGPPCQPFSIGGKHKGHLDQRNLFPEAVRAVREIQPKVVMLENVAGFMRPAFAKFFEYVILQITHPEFKTRGNEDWRDHLKRLQRYHAKGAADGLHYNVIYRLINAADYGVPQHRRRVFIVGFRRDLKLKWSFPEPSHSLDGLLYAQWVTGEYWERHGIAKRCRGEIPTKYGARIPRLRAARFWPELNSWQTVRDAIADLPDPRRRPFCTHENHVYNPGARAYGGHTGSPIDEPAKTLKAGDHGVPGGENMLSYPSGDVRYFTVRESARLQTFPDDFAIQGSWTEAMRQLGNAVAVKVAHVLASSIMDVLKCQTTEFRRDAGRNAIQSA